MASDLDRFVAAQDDGGTYQRALAELRNGRKQSHWMWFVFPQLDGLGMSPTSRFYGVHGLDEARRYLDHDVLGERLGRCCRELLRRAGDGRTAQQIFGGIDAMKLRSCMTLFAEAAGHDEPDEPTVFEQVLTLYFNGEPDPETLRRL